MDRSVIKISRLKDKRPGDDFVPGTPASRIGLLWELTKEAASLSGKYDAEQRLQRHITVIKRRKL